MAAEVGPLSFFAEVHRLKPISKSYPTAFVTLLCAALVVVATAAQAPQNTPRAAVTATPSPIYSAPTNLKVLPRNLTGQQVHDIMEQWNVELGVRCGACHAEDPGIVTTDGPPRPALAEDSKALKEIARIMYTMTEQINTNYIVRVAGSSKPVTCATCHRGNIGPEPSNVQPAGGPFPDQVPPILKEGPQPQ